MSHPVLDIRGLRKSFTLHTQGNAVLPVLTDLAFQVGAGECVILDGPSGTGKSSLLRCLYGNYLAATGSSIRVRRLTGAKYTPDNNNDDEILELVGAPPHVILDVRARTIGFVSQFLRVIPRIPTLRLVCEPLLALGIDAAESEARAQHILGRLNIPHRLWSLAPATFSGGEQQRVNIARTFVVDYPVLLLDEPTASLDAANRAAVIDLILAAKARGAAIVGICHDRTTRNAIADRLFPMSDYRASNT